jgi:glycosyltransferase involved in cell wall biosynthesis
MPVYNCESYILEAITSALAQTLQDIEICIVDDCSSDGTVDIIKELASKDSRIKYFRNSQI